jgi:hypothetical protein
MVDVARDARWGRVMEGAGEDPFLGSKIAVARVFPGRRLVSHEHYSSLCQTFFMLFCGSR